MRRDGDDVDGSTDFDRVSDHLGPQTVWKVMVDEQDVKVLCRQQPFSGMDSCGDLDVMPVKDSRMTVLAKSR